MFSIRIELFSLFILLHFISATVCAQVLTGKAIEIKDGDTFVLRTTEGTNVTIRLHAIDCPEKGQDFGKRAKEFTATFCMGGKIEARVVDEDRYGRKVAEVLVDGHSLNQALLRNGLAWHYTKYSNDASLAALEQEARKAGVGIWSRNAPMAPWTYRHKDELKPVGPLQSQDVIICNSKASKTYHNKVCQGLSRCGKGMQKISIHDATGMGKTACGYCYK